MSNQTLHLAGQESLRLPAISSPYRILHIEDDTEVARVSCATLELQGYQCHCATDGLNALELMYNFQPHLVLLDVMLPGMSGMEVLTAIRRQSDVPIIIVSALANDQTDLQDLQGIDDKLGKPFSPIDLAGRIKALLARYYES